MIGLLPAGHYVMLTYTGSSNGVAGNASLGWADSHGFELDRSDDERGEAFRMLDWRRFVLPA